MLSDQAPLSPIQSEKLQAESGVKHGFFTRKGGVSEGIYQGLNVGIGSDDDQERVTQNRSKVADHFNQPADKLITLYQVHSPDALVISDTISDNRPRADAIVTNTPGLIAGIVTADCGPVLFSDAAAGVVGCAHAGWKGATGGVLENTISTMESLGAKRQNIKAVLGPTISQKSYEVGPEFVERLTHLDHENSRWLIPSAKPEHAMFDLPGYIVNRLQKAEIDASWTGHCTYEDPELFFSYRRKTHRNEADYGRQISAICVV